MVVGCGQQGTSRVSPVFLLIYSSYIPYLYYLSTRYYVDVVKEYLP